MLPLRGNVETRLRKLDEEQYDAIILAAAGLIRLGLEDRITHHFDSSSSLPAVGQGIIGIECRADDAAQHRAGARARTTRRVAVLRSRARVRAAAAGQLSVADRGHARIEGGQVHLRGVVGSPDGREIYRGVHSGAVGDDPGSRHGTRGSTARRRRRRTARKAETRAAVIPKSCRR